MYYGVTYVLHGVTVTIHVITVLQHVQNALETLRVTAQLCQDRCDQTKKAGSVALKLQTCSMPMHNIAQVYPAHEAS